MSLLLKRSLFIVLHLHTHLFYSPEFVFLFTPIVLVLRNQFHELTGAMLRVAKNCIYVQLEHIYSSKLQTNYLKVKSAREGMPDIKKNP